MTNSREIQIPIEIRIRVGDITIDANPTGKVQGDQVADVHERMWLEEDYTKRPGYDVKFLGGESVELPTLSNKAMKLVSHDLETDREDSHVLHYHHFSLVMHAKRRMQIYSACNTTRHPDLAGTWSRKELSGGSDRWILDPRIPIPHQVQSKELYGPLNFDRGHVVKRDDVYWGTTEELAQFANFDTFHYTNCTPQHPSFNRSNKKGLWGLLENHIAEQGETSDFRMNLFAGPVLQKNDPLMNGIKIPRRYWKVIVARHKDTGDLGAWAFLLSQSGLVRQELEAEEGIFDPGDFETYMVSISRIERLTSLRFPKNVREADRHEANEAAGDDVTQILSLADLEI